MIVEPVDNGLRVDAEISGERLDATLVGVGVARVRLAQRFLLVARKEHARLLERWRGGLRVGQAAGCRGADRVGVDTRRTPLLSCNTEHDKLKKH